MSNHESSTVVGAAVVGAACGGILMVASRGRFPRTNTALIADQTASVSKMMRDMTQALRRDIHQDISKDMRSEIGEMLKDVDRLVRGTEKYSSDAQNIVDVTKKIFGQLKCGRGKFNDGN